MAVLQRPVAEALAPFRRIIASFFVLTLAGLVKSPEQTAIASAYAQRQDGVMRVDNHLSPAPQ